MTSLNKSSLIADLEFDLDALKQQWRTREPLTEAQFAGPSPSVYEQNRHSHKRSQGGR